MMLRILSFPFASLATALGLSLASLHAGPTEDALKMGEESFAAGDHDSAITAWANAYNERAVAGTANDDTCAKLLLKTGNALSEASRRDPALVCFEKLYPLSAGLYGPKAPETGIAACSLCELLVDTGGDLERAQRLGDEALAILSQAGDEYINQRYMAMINLAYVSLGKKDRLEANKRLIQCVEFARQNPKVERGKLGQVHLMLGDISGFFGRTKDQIRHQQTAIDYTIQGYGKYDPRAISAVLGLSNLSSGPEKTQILETLYDTIEATPAEKRTKGYHMTAAASERTLALAVFQTDRKRAIDIFKTAARHGIQGWGETSGELITIYVDLAKLLLVDKRYDEGIECYQKVLVIRKQLLGNEHESTRETQKILDTLIAEVKKVRD